MSGGGERTLHFGEKVRDILPIPAVLRVNTKWLTISLTLATIKPDLQLAITRENIKSRHQFR